MPTKAYAAQSPTTPLAPFSIERRVPGAKDVAIDILFCGVCHSDLHTVRGEWPGILYPSVPGHEIVGRVTKTGGGVSKVKVGDIVGVGCMVDSCRSCFSCDDGLEQYCEHGFIGTYNGNAFGGSENTYGGYSTDIVVDEHFVLKVSHKETRSRRGGAAALRRHHHLVAAPALEGRAGTEGRHSRPRRARPYGREACRRARRRSHRIYDIAGQDRGREEARRAQCRRLARCRRHGGRRPARSTSSSTPSRRRTASTRSSTR